MLKSTNIGAELKLLALKAFPASVAGTYSTGWVDIKQDIDGPFDSAVAFGSLGTAANTPTTQALSLFIEDATDSSGTGAAAYKADGVTNTASAPGIAAAAPGTNNGQPTQLNFKAQHARRFIRVRGTLAFTGGSTPTNDVTLGLMVGGGGNFATTPPNP